MWTKLDFVSYNDVTGTSFDCLYEKQTEMKWSMKRICGFAMFWIAVGMLVMMLLESVWIALLIVAALLICGYNLFCG